jgi:hypothetical protein
VYWYIGRYDGQIVNLQHEEVENYALYSKEEIDRMDTSQFRFGSLQWANRFWDGKLDVFKEKLGK